MQHEAITKDFLNDSCVISELNSCDINVGKATSGLPTSTPLFLFI